MVASEPHHTGTVDARGDPAAEATLRELRQLSAGVTCASGRRHTLIPAGYWTAPGAAGCRWGAVTATAAGSGPTWPARAADAID